MVAIVLLQGSTERYVTASKEVSLMDTTHCRIGPSESESLAWLSLGRSGITVTRARCVFTLWPGGRSAWPDAHLQGAGPRLPDSVPPLLFSSSPPSRLVRPCEPLPVSPAVKEVSSVAPLTWADWRPVGPGAAPLWVSSALAADLGSAAV
ncbi:hypothetical protein EYF80_010341 [Liparis tanakae]|uniref:Uncharacterized protein n=1 Tax=Liparis tanakae TaxID=230148 RepID=A0A4Z2IPV9_9TELE|nr:hypothetical protein EYF80_010341 [Liparis tanakae]